MISGLLYSNEGSILIDGKLLTRNNSKTWQHNISLVPQTIFLSDESILNNICIGLNLNEVDKKKLDASVNKAQLRHFLNEMPQDLNTIIGERGVRLSGGQRQRIGLARGLYKNKEILILDEATNALDHKTEAKIMNELKNLPEDITVIIVSHRPKTLSFCNKVIKI